MQAARPHLSAPCPIGAQTPYLCATLPFLMSEMIRGSPRLLLAAGGEEAETMTPRWPQGVDQGLGRTGYGLEAHTLFTSWSHCILAVGKSAHLPVPWFPLSTRMVMPQPSRTRGNLQPDHGGLS